MKLSNISTDRLQQVAENFASSKSETGVFFEYPPFSPQSPREGVTTTFTKNEILEELESRLDVQESGY